jgi:PTS system mannose-specific IIB component/fructoselysine and glucoselysine-specific PTS system IIB component
VAITLFRIDERLLHGQVLVGWGTRLGIDYYVVVDDDLAKSPWEQELYASGLTSDMDAFFLSMAAATKRFDELDGRAGNGVLITRGTAAMRSLAEAGHLEGRRINVGGLHGAESRRRALDYVYLADEEADDLIRMEPLVSRISARDLPTAPEVPLEQLLRSIGRS